MKLIECGIETMDGRPRGLEVGDGGVRSTTIPVRSKSAIPVNDHPVYSTVLEDTSSGGNFADLPQ